MTTLRYTLLSDGASDRVLLPVIDWLLLNNSQQAFTGQWAELRWLARPPKKLADRIARAVELYPCQLLFVHRDAENATHAARIGEIRAALPPAPPAVCVVPVRMQEAWLLFNEVAIREAAANPHGTARLELPPGKRIESTANPKRILHSALLVASGLHGRRRAAFPVRERTHRLAALIDDYSPLRALPAFSALETALRILLVGNGWQ